jgi:transposase
VIWDFPGGRYCCPDCGEPFTLLGTHLSGEQLDWQVTITVRGNCRRRYQRECGCEGPATVMAPGPPKAIGKGLFTNGFIAMLLAGRFAAGGSMNSLVTGLARHGAGISAATLAGTVARAAGLLAPLAAAIEERNRESWHFHADETTWRVLCPGEGKCPAKWWGVLAGVAFEVAGVLGVGVVLPFPGVRGLVVADGELGDPGLEVVAGGEVAAAQEFPGEDAEPLLNHVQPGGVLRGIGDGEPGVRGDPCPAGLGGVAGAVVHDQVDPQVRGRALIEHGQEPDEGDGVVAGDPLGDDLAGRHVHRRDDGDGAVPDVLELAAGVLAGAAGVGLYHNPPDKAVVLCVDKKSGTQALDRSQPVLPMMPGMPERRSHDYVRYGTTSLFAAFNIADGTVISSLHRRHRAVEFRKFLVRIDKAVPADLDVHLVCDNLATGKTAAIQEWLARHPRFHLHFTPTGSSWINQVERWFGYLTDQMLRRGVHKSVQALEADNRTWIDSWNENPKPFIWTKTAEEILESLARYLEKISPAARETSNQLPSITSGGGH